MVIDFRPRAAGRGTHITSDGLAHRGASTL